MKKNFFTALAVCVTISCYAQKEISAAVLLNQIRDGKTVDYENVTITGDINFPSSETATPTGKYPQNGKTVYVLSNFLMPSISFRNCVFKGRLNFCFKKESDSEKKEYRVEFKNDVFFENCLFEKIADFELVNFDKGVSFEGSVFREQPKFVRVGLYQKPALAGIKLDKGCLFQLDQSKKSQVFSAQELTKIINAMR